MARSRIIAWSLTICTATLYLAFSSGLSDFIAYWTAGRLFVQGANPYDVQSAMNIQRDLGWSESSPLMMWNLPHALLLFGPLSLVRFTWAKSLWIIFSALSVLWAADRLWQLFRGDPAKRWISWACALCFLPVPLGLSHAQLGVLFFPVVTVFFLSVTEKRWLLTALTLVVLGLKPHLFSVLVLFCFLWAHRNRSLQKLTFTLFLLVTVILAGLTWLRPTLWSDYIMATRMSETSPFLYYTPTVGTLLRRLITPRPAIAFLPTCLGLMISPILWRRWARDFDWYKYFTAIMVLSLLSAPFYWLWDVVLLLPAVLMLLVDLSPSNWKGSALVAGANVLLVIELLLKANGFLGGDVLSAGVWFPWLIAIVFFLNNRRLLGAARREDGGETEALPVAPRGRKP